MTRPRQSYIQPTTPLVAIQAFIDATRDSGYKSTGSAIAELIDNALEANAKNIQVNIEESPSEQNQTSFLVRVTDDGAGMPPDVLRLALQFGGSTRFGSRVATGRYGMGLPNGGLSQARRIEVVSWTKPSQIWRSYLDADEISAGEVRTLPPPRVVGSSDFRPPTRSGTVVTLSKCDRLDHKRLTALEQKLAGELGRVFRQFLYSGRRIILNGRDLKPIDPLFLKPGLNKIGARLYGPPLKYSVRVPTSVHSVSQVSTITVIFAELPIQSWHRFSNEEKNELGIAKNAGVSIIRAGREIDYGWYFMGTKRKENYDDWWRCEIRFTPELDELFGVTHSKQRINPTEVLCSILVPEIERIARELNSRVRKQYVSIRAKEVSGSAVKRLQGRDYLLEPPKGHRTRNNLRVGVPQLLRRRGNGVSGLKFSVDHERTEQDEFYSPMLNEGVLRLVLNEAHPFYERVYNRLANSRVENDREALQGILLLLLSGARTELMLSQSKEREIMTRFRRIWSDTIAAFLA